MIKIKINGKPYQVAPKTTILEACKMNNIYVPTLCFLKDINEVAACRMCVVEIEGRDRLVASCNNYVEEGMVINTKSKRVLESQKTNLQLILSKHNMNCKQCKRNNNCSLQTIAKKFKLLKNHEYQAKEKKWDDSFPLVRDASKCIQCMRCINICEKVQGLGVWKLNGTGAHAKIEVRDGLNISDVNCSICGQCITHCPVNALSERDDTAKLRDAINDKDKITVMQIAPAVRSAFGQAFNLNEKKATVKRMVAAAKSLGIDYVFDTNFSADLTIMEEGSELIEYLGKRKDDMPMFTSCCPGWVRFVKNEFPDFVKNLSSAKSPQQMFGAVTKTYFAKKLGVKPEKIFCVSVMPCVAKKYECSVEEVNSGKYPDVDMSITTREFARMLEGVDVAKLDEMEFDSPLGTSSGAAVIFGATGGVMEAALRSAYYLVNKKNPKADSFEEVRAVSLDKVGKASWREAKFTIKKGLELKVAVTSGLANTRALLNAIRNKEVQYDFVEIMACPGGCAGGGGQPIKDGEELSFVRGKRLYKLDKNNKIRFSHKNPEVIKLYEDFLEEPLSKKAHKLLHTNQDNWKL